MEGYNLQKEMSEAIQAGENAIIQQVASGSVGNWKKLWSFSRNMMCMWFPMRSGPI